MNTSISIVYNMGGKAFWQNPNIWVGDAQGKPITPVSGQPAYLWCKPQNTGDVTAQDVSVSFWVLIPSSKLYYKDIPATSTGFAPAIEVGGSLAIRGDIPWIPDASTGTHKCIACVVSCLNCPPPELIPGEPIPRDSPQVGQRNTSIQTASYSYKKSRHAAMGTEGVQAEDQITRPFSVKTDQPATLQLVRVPLQLHRIDLEVADVPNTLPDAPGDKEFYLRDMRSGKKLGLKTEIEAHREYDFEVVVIPRTIVPGTGAMYQVSQIENDVLVGGVSHVIKHQ